MTMSATTPINATLAAIMLNGTTAKFDIGACLNTVTALRGAYPDANLSLTLNLTQCYRYCGTGIGPYQIWDVNDALVTWVFPLLILLGNIGFTSTTWFGSGWKRFWGHLNAFAVDTHLLANPLNAIYQLATKLDVGRRMRLCCNKINLDEFHLSKEDEKKARRDIANVCYALDDFGQEACPLRIMCIIKSLNTGNLQKRLTALKATRLASHNLALARVNSKLQSGLAVGLYGVAVFAALLRTKSEDSVAYPQPHTIALRELYYWLLLAIILSAAAGKWPLQWTPQKILNKLGKDINASECFPLDEIKPWDGGNYVWRPGNNIFLSNGRSIKRHSSYWNPFKWAILEQRVFVFELGTTMRDRRHLWLLATSFISVGLSWAMSFLISWKTPTVGLGGRGICEIVFLVVWLGNFVFTEWLGTRIQGRRLFQWVWMIDTCISFSMLFVLFAAFQGKFKGLH